MLLKSYSKATPYRVLNSLITVVKVGKTACLKLYFLVIIILFTMNFLGFYVSAYSQTALPDLENSYQKAFDAMQLDMANPERSFEFVQAAIELGDVQGAITALERILRLNPTLANIRLELGVLYLRVGSPVLATTYLRQALAAPKIPDTVRNRAQRLLAQAERAEKRHHLNGSLYLAGRYDSNANAAPESKEVLVGGESGFLREEDTGRDDFSGEFVASLQYSYVLPSQVGHVIEAALVTYNRRYDQSSEINVNTISLDVGPRFFLGSLNTPEFSIRPFVSTSYLFLDDDDYLRTLGGGIEIRKRFSLAWLGEVTLAAEDLTFFDTEERQASSDRSGFLLSLTGRIRYQVQPATLLSASAKLVQRDSDADFESFFAGGGTLSLTQIYEAPFRLTASAWSTALSVGIRHIQYDEADPTIDPDERRQDTRLEIILSTNMPLTDSLTMIVSALLTYNTSSLPNFEFDNQGGSIGLAWSF